jgi:FkbM family methyltransferase
MVCVTVFPLRFVLFLFMFQPTSFLGRAIRLPLQAVPKSSVMPILAGPNRGLRWIVGAGTHGCWLGRYERQEIAWFIARLTPGSVVWDIGAHAGFFTLACAPRCASVVACEPAPRNVAFLRRHIELNRLKNVEVVEAAIFDRHATTVRFGSEHDAYQGRIGGMGASVPTATIDALVQSGLPAPTIMKIDIEGAEVEALRGGLQTLTAHRPSILLGTHGEQPARECRQILNQLGYHQTQINVATIWAIHR